MGLKFLLSAPPFEAIEAPMGAFLCALNNLIDQMFICVE
jgi:hypothetical protein